LLSRQVRARAGILVLAASANSQTAYPPSAVRVAPIIKLAAGLAFASAAYYLTPIVVSLVVIAYQYALEHFGWKEILALVAVAVFVPIL
jgi:hypothetical protein